MVKVTVNINGKDYNLKGKDNEKYLIDIAEYVDGKIKEITSKNKFLSTGDAAVLAAVNIADELNETDKENIEMKKIKISLEERNQTLSDTIKELRENAEKSQEKKRILVNQLNDKINELRNETSKLRESNKLLTG